MIRFLALGYKGEKFFAYDNHRLERRSITEGIIVKLSGENHTLYFEFIRNRIVENGLELSANLHIVDTGQGSLRKPLGDAMTNGFR